MTTRILIGDALEQLKTLPAESVHCCVTSPPYYGLRDYGTAEWVGGDPECDHKESLARSRPELQGCTSWGERDARPTLTCPKCGATRKDGQIGLEPTPEEHISALVAVFREVQRVLRKDGVLWLNYGDAYNAGTAATRKSSHNNDVGGWQSGGQMGDARVNAIGLKPKDLLMLPSRVALALQTDGWWLRSMMPWVKRSAMPESVTDRPATAIEYVFLLTKSGRYYFDMEAVRVGSDWGGQTKKPDGWATHDGGHGSFHRDGREKGAANQVKGGSRNFRNSDLFYASLEPPHGLISSEDGPLALDVNPAGFAESHFATFPPKLIEPLIKAATSEKGCCAECGAPWVREVDRQGEWRAQHDQVAKHDGTIYRVNPGGGVAGKNVDRPAKTLGWSPSCQCNAETENCTVLDPFGGAGTTALVADRLGRDCILIELNPDYADMARRRVQEDAGMFAELTEC